MSEPYEECFDGQSVTRSSPPASHELLCDRLHFLIDGALPKNSTLKRLPRRTPVPLSAHTCVRPDLALVKPGERQIYLFAEVLVAGDHRADTVTKKNLCQHHLLPKLWIVDPRYLNVEVYATSPHGFRLEQILANQECLTDSLLPGLNCSMQTLFKDLRSF